MSDSGEKKDTSAADRAAREAAEARRDQEAASERAAADKGNRLDSASQRGEKTGQDSAEQAGRPKAERAEGRDNRLDSAATGPTSAAKPERADGADRRAMRKDYGAIIDAGGAPGMEAYRDGKGGWNKDTFGVRINGEVVPTTTKGVHEIQVETESGGGRLRTDQDIGHAKTLKSGNEPTALEPSGKNRSEGTIEKAGTLLEKDTRLHGDAPVNVETARDMERVGLLPKGAAENLPRHDGYTRQEAAWAKEHHAATKAELKAEEAKKVADEKTAEAKAAESKAEQAKTKAAEAEAEAGRAEVKAEAADKEARAKEAESKEAQGKAAAGEKAAEAKAAEAKAVESKAEAQAKATEASAAKAEAADARRTADQKRDEAAGAQADAGRARRDAYDQRQRAQDAAAHLPM